jgi:hypothetical protein
MRTHRRRGSRVWYVFTRVVVVGAIVWFGLGLLLGWQALNRQVEAFARVPLPGDAEMSFDKPGGYVVYLEGAATRTLGFGPPFALSLTPVGGGQEIPVGRYGPALSYRLGGHSGSAVGTFRIDRPGRYVLRAERFEEGPPANVAVGRGLRPAIVRALVTAFAVPVVVLLGGTARVLVAAVRRFRARHAAPAADPAPDPAAAPDSDQPAVAEPLEADPTSESEEAR